MGKGDFILENAKRYPDKNFIGIEKYSTVLTIAVKKAKNDEIPSNLRYLKEDAVRLNEVFDDEEIDGIFLNFSDPWPKKRHTKRRLTYKSFLDVYKKLIKDQGHLVFKTDNRGLFEYSLSSFANYGLTFEDICLDLHHSEGYDDNIQTEYERKFSPRGPIYRADVVVDKEKIRG
jgi:tRNA (guanine-N7-)-methyltransferase